jgi:hypothetical protein
MSEREASDAFIEILNGNFEIWSSSLQPSPLIPPKESEHRKEI